MKKLYFLILGLLISLTSFAQVINEIDSDTPSTDVAEFIEIKWTANTALDGLVVVLYNGSNDTSYAAFDLDGYTTDTNGFFILGNTGIISAGDLDMGASNILQNGQDAVAIFTGNDTDFPNGTPVTNVNLIDALVYGTSDPDATGLLTGLGETVQYDENANANSAGESVQRKTDGTYETKAPTFRSENDTAVCELTLTTTSTTCDATTMGVDTYTATLNFTGGGTATYSVMADFGSVDLSGGDPTIDATGTITVTGISEGTDVTITVTGAGGLCDLSSVIASPVCEPSTGLPIYEPFDYNVGEGLSVQTNWTGYNSGDDLAIISGSLFYNGLEASAGNSVSFDGAGMEVKTEFSPISSGTVYSSFIMKVTDQSAITDLTDGGYVASLSASDSGYDLRLWVHPNPDANSSTYDIAISDVSSSPTFSSSTYNVGDNIFIVMSYEPTTGIYKGWINPSSASFGGSEPTADFNATDATAASTIDRFIFRQDSTGETPFLEFDELRIGTTWADVTPNNLSVGEFLSSSVKIFPNPTTSTGIVNIVSTNSSPMEVRVFDILGKQVRTQTVTSTLNVSGLKSGIYILNITQEGHTVTKKLVIE